MHGEIRHLRLICGSIIPAMHHPQQLQRQSLTRTRKCLRRSGSTWGDGFIRVSDTFNCRPALWLMSDRRPILRLNVTGGLPLSQNATSYRKMKQHKHRSGGAFIMQYWRRDRRKSPICSHSGLPANQNLLGLWNNYL